MSEHVKDSSDTDDISIGREPESVSCPICLRDLKGLQLLNRHLDIDHGFDDSRNKNTSNTSNNNTRKHPSAVERNKDRGNKGNEKAESNTTKYKLDKRHWEIYSKGKKCNEVNCRIKLNASTGYINCRKCGKLYCRRHCTNIIKLNKNGDVEMAAKNEQSSPTTSNSSWFHCCHNCFISKPGFNDFGLMNNLTDSFVKIRNQRNEDSRLMKLQLESRLVQLLNGIIELIKKYRNTSTNSSNHNTNSSIIISLRFNSERYNLEKNITPWVDDSKVTTCNICETKFSMLRLIRKHHCRLCGNIVCDSWDTNCSSEVPILTLQRNANDLPFEINDIDDLEKHTQIKNVSIRVCKRCLRTIYVPRKFKHDIDYRTAPLIVIKYRKISNVARVITDTLPRFQQLLQNEEVKRDSGEADKSVTEDISNLKELSKVRDRLLKTFSTYNTLTKQILVIKPSTHSERIIQNSIRIVSSNFVSEKFLPLKAMDTILSPAASGNTTSSLHTSGSSTPDTYNTSGITAIKPLSSVMEGLSIKEIKQYREELMVLQEQTYLLDPMIQEAKKQRKFEEVTTLTTNLTELNDRIKELQLKLGDEGF